MFNNGKSFLISVVGPTAVGKTALSIKLAQHFGTEIISADSRQMYRRLNIGTAKPTPEEMMLVPHHLVDWLDTAEELNAEKFRQEAEETIQQLFQSHNVVVVVGGSTLYMQALWFGLNDMPAIPASVRDALNAEFRDQGIHPLLEELRQADPETYERIDRQNHARVIRAIEVYRATGRPVSSFRTPDIPRNNDWNHIKIALRDDREALYDRINRRVDAMIETGLEDEIQELLDSGLDPDCQAMRSIGYQEWVGYFQGKYDRKEAIRLHKRNSRRYAKRQMTWYRRYEDVTWFEAGKPEKVLSWVVETGQFQ